MECHGTRWKGHASTIGKVKIRVGKGIGHVRIRKDKVRESGDRTR